MSDTDKIPDIDAGDILFQRFIAETDRRERRGRKDSKPSSNDGVDVNLTETESYPPGGR